MLVKKEVEDKRFICSTLATHNLRDKNVAVIKLHSRVMRDVLGDGNHQELRQRGV